VVVTTTWDDDSVLAASDAWSWVPDEARVHRTEELLVVAYPDYVGTPTVARSLGSDRDAAGLVAEAHDAARSMGRDRVWWQVSGDRRPEGLPEALEVSRAAFGDPPVTDEMVTDQLVEVLRTIETSTGGRVLASVHGRPASTGGFTLVGVVARLWGGGTHPDLRGRGAYRATLAARLHLAAELGATLALTHGRVDSSSPILQRLGFTRHGEQQQIVVDL
jgi:GNAT superfamily N-acetyltransferase